MRFIPYVTQEYSEVLKALTCYLDNIRQCDDDCRMDSLIPILDRIRALQYIETTVLYANLKTVGSLDIALAQAEADHALIADAIDAIIFIHVDEPENQHVRRVEELRQLLEKTQQTDAYLLETCPQVLTESEMALLNKATQNNRIPLVT